MKIRRVIGAKPQRGKAAPLSRTGGCLWRGIKQKRRIPVCTGITPWNRKLVFQHSAEHTICTTGALRPFGEGGMNEYESHSCC